MTSKTSRPWGIHSVFDLWSGKCIATSPDGKNWYRSSPLPYTGNRLRAAWWVLTGRAYAVVWPSAGDLEKIWERP